MFRDSSPPWLSVSVGFQSLGQCCMLCSRFSLKSYKVLWQAGLPLSFVCCFIHSILSLSIYIHTPYIYIYICGYLFDWHYTWSIFHIGTSWPCTKFDTTIDVTGVSPLRCLRPAASRKCESSSWRKRGQLSWSTAVRWTMVFLVYPPW